MSDDVRLHTRIASLEQQLANREAIIGKLLAEIKRLKHRQFGSSSERVEATLQQLGLALEAMQSAPPPVAEPSPTQDADSKVTPLRRPRTLPPELPRQVIVHAPEGHCPDCGTSLRPLGEDVSEMLHWVPGHFEVIRHVRPKLSCGQCSRVVQQPAPSRPIPRAMATPGLLAQVVISKYADHLPLYRQAAIYRRAGLELHRATLADWVGEAARLVAPLADALGRYVRAAAKVHADDTPLPVLDPGRGKTRTARLWTYVRDDRPAGCLDPPAVWYRYSPDRKGIHPQTHLAGFTGILQADGYAGYAPLYAQGVREAACWAHARRKFHEVYAVDQSPLAGEAIRRIGLLYAIEREIRGEPPAVRRAVRQERALGLLDGLHAWLSATLQQVSGRSSLAAAIQYSLAGRIGRVLELVFAPIGFNWQISIALVPGMAAREVAVGALATVYALAAAGDNVAEQLGPLLAHSWSLATALSLLVWYIYAPMCLSTLAVVRRETNSWRYPLLLAGYLFALAYGASFLTYRVALWLGAGGVT